MIDEFEFFLEKHWSDGLPVVTPTEARVAKMLEATRRDPGRARRKRAAGDGARHRAHGGDTRAHGRLQTGVSCRSCSARLPLMLREEFNMNGVQGTMHGVAPLMIVNGPYAQKIGIHGGNGCFGPGFRANATIGRAIRLMMLNLGGGIAGHRVGDDLRDAAALHRVHHRERRAQPVGDARGVERLRPRTTT